MRYILHIILLFSFSFSVLSQNSRYDLVPSEKRIVTDLAGKWEISSDNEDSWREIYVPHSTRNSKKIIYKKSINLNLDVIKEKNLILKFFGTNDRTEVLLNNQLLTNYFGGLTPFEVLLPDNLLKNGKNEIKVIVYPLDSYPRSITKNTPYSQRNYNGIIRDIVLEAVSKVWIKDIKYKYEFSPNLDRLQGVINIRVNSNFGNLARFSNKKIILRTSISSRNATKSIVDSRTIEVENSRVYDEKFEFSLSDVKLWDIENPNLYDLNVEIYDGELLIDDLTEKIGFRKIETASGQNGNKILLNKRELKIKGINYIEDFIERGNAINLKRYLSDNKLIDKLGANLIRLKYSTPNEHLVRICDELGILLLVDLPMYSVPSGIMSKDELVVRLSNQFEQYYENFENSPSIMAWGVYFSANESSSGTISYHATITQSIKKISDKLIYKSVINKVDDILTDNIDFISVEFINRKLKHGLISKDLNKLQELSRGLPILLEVGVPIQENNLNGYSDNLSLEYQAYYYANFIEYSKTRNFTGVIINSFNDYLLNNPILQTNSEKLYLMTSGLVDRSRNERLSYSVIKAYFNDEKEPLLNAGSKKDDQLNFFFTIFGISAMMLLFILINRFRRFREYFFRSIIRPYNFYADVRDQRIISTFQTIILAIIISAGVASYFGAILFNQKSNVLTEIFLNLLIPTQIAKENLFSLAWSPILMTVLFMVLVFLKILFIAFLLRVIVFFMNIRVFYKDVFTITVWSFVPLLILLTVSVFIPSIIEATNMAFILFSSLYLILALWSLFRLFKSSAVVFDKNSSRVYLIETIVFGAVLGIPLFIYELNNSFISYLLYFLEVYL